MTHLTRRDFLKLAGMAAASLALLETGCSPKGQISVKTPGPRQAPAPSANQAYLAVVRGADPAILVKAALASLGGIQRFVNQGQDVIIKPNICVDYHPPEYAATTNPVVVGTLVALCREAGAKRVRVMDSPFAGISPTSAYAASGIEAAVKAAGGEMEVMSPIKFAKFEIPLGKSITSWNIYRDVLETDILIDVPIAKNHSLARLTLAGKNLLGVVSDPNQIHSDLAQRVADLISLIRPTLTVVDAYRILVEHGPTGGSLNDVKPANTIIASHDIIAADAFAATLFGLTGADVPYIRKGADMGLGTLDLASVKVEEVNV
jgi:uncharacterized protein (DUF362 family)